MTRARIPPGPVLQEAYGVLDKFKISRTFFVRTDQEGCALAASDINAANGITAVSTVAEAVGNEQKRLPILGNDTPEQPEKPITKTSSTSSPPPVIALLGKKLPQAKESQSHDINSNLEISPTTGQNVEKDASIIQDIREKEIVALQR